MLECVGANSAANGHNSGKRKAGGGHTAAVSNAVERYRAADDQGHGAARQEAACGEAETGASRVSERASSAGIVLCDRRSQCRRRPAGRTEHGEPDDGVGAGPEQSSGDAPRRNPRSCAGPRRGHARRRRQGQSILSARLQSRSRHRSGDLRRRHAGQPADPRAWPGLRRSQLADAGNRQQPRHSQGAVLCRRRRLRQRRHTRGQSARQRRQERCRGNDRQLRLRAAFHHGLNQARWRLAALCRRGQYL